MPRSEPCVLQTTVENLATVFPDRMQNSQFDNPSYPPGIYSPSQGIYTTSQGHEGNTLKLQHGHYPDTDTGYGNYVNPANPPPNFIPREPPTYAESTFFHSGFVSNSGTAYYKVPGRQLDLNLPAYDIQRSDQLLLKSEVTMGNGLEYVQRYEADDTKVLHEMDNVVKVQAESDDYKHGYQTRVHQDGKDEQAEDTIPAMAKDEKSDDKSSEEQTIAAVQNDEETGKNNPDVKPTLSYIALIAKSILESTQKRLNLGSIYSWIEQNYPYYLNKGQGWRNSVRHNLSLNDCFIKAGRCEDGKGNYWAIHPANAQDFMRGDFRQRRRSRRRGRKKDGEFGMYSMSNSFLPPTNTALNPGVSFNHPAAIAPLYSPYTEAERRAYKLDEAMLRHSMTNPFMRWYPNTGYGTNGTSCNAAMYGTTSGQWQSYPETSSPQSPYQPFTRSYSTATLV